MISVAELLNQCDQRNPRQKILNCRQVLPGVVIGNDEKQEIRLRKNEVGYSAGNCQRVFRHIR